MWNFIRFDLYYFLYGLCFIVMCFFGCCMQCLRMYWCNFHYNCVRIYTTNCATFCVLACLVLFTIYWMRNIENQAIARMTRDAQHRQRRPLKNGWITTTNCPTATPTKKIHQAAAYEEKDARHAHLPFNYHNICVIYKMCSRQSIF